MNFCNWLSADAREHVVKFLNDCWLREEFLEDFEKADVITLYKKGNVADPSNYRPISLLDTLYKIYAALIKNRLLQGLEERIWKTQFGFRPKHSTIQALYIARRLMENASSQQE